MDIIAGLGLVAKLVDVATTKQYESYPEIGKSLMDTVNGKDAALLKTNGSMTSLIGNFMVQPLIVVTNSMKNNQYLDKLIDLQMDVFVSFYMQTFEILRGVYGKDVETIISILGTGNGSVLKSGRVIAGKLLSSEDIEPDYLGELFSCESLNIGNFKNAVATSNMPNVKQTEYDEKSQLSSTVVHRTISITTTVKVKVDDKIVEHNFILPITVRANVVFLPIDELLLTLKANTRDKSLYFRFLDLKAGTISLKNFIIADDLVKEYKQNRLKSKSDYVDWATAQANSSMVKVTYDGTIGFEKYYKMVLLSSDDLFAVNKHLSGSIKNERERQEFLEELKAMTCTIVDENYDRCHMVIKDLPGESSFSLKSLNKRKDSTLDLSEIVKALMMNKPPVF